MCDAGRIPFYEAGEGHGARCTLYDPARGDEDAREARQDVHA
jgi:hypothetical protein